MIDLKIKIEPQPQGFHARLAGHHWVQEVDFDGRDGDMIVLQWNPAVKRWSHSGKVGTGAYLDIHGWKYVGLCPMPGEIIHSDMLEIRDFQILGDAQSGFKPVDAIAQFKYHGYLISMSTAGLSRGACQTHVCVFEKQDKDKVAKDGFHTVEEALEWINVIVGIKEM